MSVLVDVELLDLDALSGNADRRRARLQQQVQRLTAELGAHAVAGGPHWSNDAGQIEMLVTEQGLTLLRNSSNAVSFRAGKQWHERSGLQSGDGRFEHIERALTRDGHVDVHVLPNVDRLDFEIAPSGTVLLTPASRKAALAKSGDLLAGMSDRQVLDRGAATARLATARSLSVTGNEAARAAPVLTVRLTREGVIRLATSADVRSLTPVGHVDTRPLQVDAEALRFAERDGSADVLITLRTPLLGGALTPGSVNAQSRAQRSALGQVLATAGVELAGWRDLSLFGATSGRLSRDQLRALSGGADKRLLSITLNKAIAEFTLATSTPTMNMPSAWNTNYRGADQSVIVIDSGVQTNHAFLRDGANVSRVIYEGCFGTNGVRSGVTYQSMCPNQDANGDSPLGLAGSAAPLTACSSVRPSACDHGTHVAGIAAGRNSAAAPAGAQGVAPDAKIVALQVSSFDVNRVRPPVPFTQDILAAMAAAAGALGSAAALQPYTINLSIGGGSYAAACGTVEPAFTNAVALLKAAGVPVVAATGNDYHTGSVGWPACVPGVIQVSSVNNDGVGNNRSVFGVVNGVTTGANLARPSQFPAEYMWLVPGGGSGTVVQSSAISAPGTASYKGQQGTSQAAPHVAGLYAVIKGVAPTITVNGASEWIKSNAREGVVVPMCLFSPCAPTDTITFDRIRLPAL